MFSPNNFATWINGTFCCHYENLNLGFWCMSMINTCLNSKYKTNMPPLANDMKILTGSVGQNIHKCGQHKSRKAGQKVGQC